MDTDFAVGDVVKLKSGGHDMTVQSIEKPNGDLLDSCEGDFRVRAAWMDDAGVFHVSPGLQPIMLDGVKKVERKSSDADDTGGAHDGAQSAIDRQDGGTVDGSHTHSYSREGSSPRPLSPVVQSDHPETVHADDDKPQSLGNEAERQPAQAAEVDHAAKTDDPHDDTGTVHEVGKDYRPDRSLKDNR